MAHQCAREMLATVIRPKTDMPCMLQQYHPARQHAAHVNVASPGSKAHQSCLGIAALHGVVS